MTTAQNYPLRPAPKSLPTMYDLPSEEIGDPGMPDEFHAHQATLLDQTFRPSAISPDHYYKAVDMNLYYDPEHPQWYKRPDWFAAVGVPRLYRGFDQRFSYVVWDEPAPPLIVVELLSPGTEKEDLGETSREAGEPPPKWEVYEKILRVPYYAIFSRGYTELRIFRLMGRQYVEVLNHGGRYWIQEAELGLGIWHGRYQGVDRLWLRWFDAHNNWIPTYEEQSEQQRLEAERAQAEAELAQAEAEHAQAEAERAQAEAKRAQAEAERAQAEAERAQAEAERAQAEAKRAQAEKEAALSREALAWQQSDLEHQRAEQAELAVRQERQRAE
ncbi:MAG TPA: Uma2 family endonuclease, partial [Blastocatellia bacterium]|nr:Uma2 family endonuclease [Blastocatellia bacterium]